MKKSLVLALVVSFVLSLAGTALAFPVDFNGDFRLQSRFIDDKIQGGASTAADYSKSFFQFRARMNFEGKVDQDTTFFGRFTVRNQVGEAQNSTAEFDHYGVKINAGDFKLAVGRQAVNLGQGSILNTGYDASGATNMFDGLLGSTKNGNVDFGFVAGRTTGSVPQEWYGLDISTKLADNATIGAAYAKKTAAGQEGRRYYAINTTVTANDNLSFNGEIVRSNATDKKSAYFLAGTYTQGKGSFTVQYNNVQKNSVDKDNSGIGAAAYPFAGYDLDKENYKGFTFAYNQNMTKTTSFHVVYMDLKIDGATGTDKELAAGVVWKF